VVASKARDKPAARPTPKRFYSRALTAAERADLPVALEIDGIDEELAILRLRLRQALEERPEDLPLMFRGIELIAKAVAARYRLSKGDKADLETTLQSVLHHVGDLIPGYLDE
jgi:hypothetical protein